MANRRKIYPKPASATAPSILVPPVVTPPALIGTPAAFTDASATGTAVLYGDFRWRIDGVDVGTLNAAYTPVLGDYGKALTVRQRVYNAWGEVFSESAPVTVTASTTHLVGDVLYVNLPAGIVGTIYVQRDGVDIVGAVSAAGVGSYSYTVVAADDGHALTPRFTGLAYETDAPRAFATYVAVAEPTIIARSYDENLDPASVPATSDFTLAGTLATSKTITGVAIAGNIVKLTCSSAFAPGDQPIISYTPGTNKLRDLAAVPNLCPAFTGIYVANQFPPPSVAVTLKTTDPRYVVGGGGFLNNGLSGNFNYNTDPALAEFGDHGILLTDDGWIEMQVADALSTTRAISLGGAASLVEMNPCARLVSGSVRAYVANVASGSAYAFASPSSACRVRIARVMPSGTFSMDTSVDSGATWTTRYTFAATSVEALSPRMLTNSASVAIKGVRVQNFVDRGY